jgi:hypothetical protein
MKGDFTRYTFRKEKHYRKVNMQQGRVQTDADWNEQNEIQFHYETTYLKDLVGKNGTLAEKDGLGGFKISGNYSFEWSKIGAPTDSGVDNDSIRLKQFLVNNFGLRWITGSTNFAKDGDNKLSISDRGHSAVIEKTGATATLRVDSEKVYEFLVKGGDKVMIYSRGFMIGPGNYYVEGLLCENDYEIDFTRQQYLPEPENPVQASKKYLAYLDVWEHHITYLDDSYIREQALGDVDTATRSKITWQIKLVDTDGPNLKNRCELWDSAVKGMEKTSTTGLMQARAKLSPGRPDRCSLYETAGYTRLENQLYRVEVHKAGNLAEATFKWSRDNGTVVSKVTEFKPTENTLVIQKRGKDSLLDFQKDGWVEVTDEFRELNGMPGSLVKLKDVEDTSIIYRPETLIGDDIIEAKYPLTRNPKVRRWESKNDKPIIDSSTVQDGGYIELESGVQVKFEDGYYRTGDYWLVPARTRTGSIEWPKVGESDSDEPLALPPAGIHHHYAPLALVQSGTDGEDGLFTAKNEEDFRSFFSSLIDLVDMDYAGGDGQQALPDNKLPLPLRVAVTLGGQPINKTPMRGVMVRFTIVQQLSSSPGSLRPLPAGSTSGQSIDVPINTEGIEGIAECEWTLGDGMQAQQVKAELYDECGKLIDLPPIHFGSTLPILFYYISGDGIEVPKGGNISTLLRVGIKIGKTLVASEYEVKFNTTAGTLSESSVAPTNGIASSTWTLTSINKPEQAWAELYYKPDPAGVATPANVEPIYFSATIPEEVSHGAAATTGLLKLDIPAEGNQPPAPLIYGPFSHHLTGLSIPPAVMLGLSTEESRPEESPPDEKAAIRYTEDYFLLLEGEIYFKPVLITPSTFMVHLLNVSRGEVNAEIILRWWAIPADAKPTTDAGPIVVEFGIVREPEPELVQFPQDNFSLQDSARVRVSHTHATKNEEVRVKLHVGFEDGPVLEMERTPEDVYISKQKFQILVGRIVIEGEPLEVRGLDGGARLIADYLDKEGNKIASGTAFIIPIIG